MLHLYNILIRLSLFILKIAGVFVEKLGKRNEGLRNQEVPFLETCIWVHAASLGEFEQGKTVIESLKRTYSDIPMVLTFFSSSGFEKMKNYDGADYVFYMPYDSNILMSKFILRIKPQVVVFIKYEFWFNTLYLLKKNTIPYYFISSVFRRSQFFMKGLFSSFFTLIRGASWIFVQDQRSQEILHSKSVYNMSISGDSRIDRVIELANNSYENKLISDFSGDFFTIIVGSSWPPDEEIIVKAIQAFPEWKWIIAPHEVHKDHIISIQDRIGRDNVILYSEIDTHVSPSPKILLVDRIGLLSRIYRYGNLAYIGGGFGTGIHNTLEPVAYGLPVIFGPKYHKFNEAVNFIESGIGKSVANADQLIEALQYFAKEDINGQVKNKIKIYLESNSGATDSIVSKIKRDLEYSNGKR
ncbi:3-deoxy-D-manno-octulosonic acid transferase [Membranihabitans maritimus]|uniref:3-deoxy-D-manno-octulosonic acid transferase n=1 Tax=Membranihabitans maritimus TaxID=2904244 RepID=UPI001F346F82|nr:glycosyltransferase N-terminal domain-containing protein [Membranihabitans maritimus]